MVGQELGRANFEMALANSRRLNVTIAGIAIAFSLIAMSISFFLPQVVGLHGHAQITARSMILIFAGANIFYVMTSVFFSAVESGGITLPSTIFSNFFQVVVTLPVAILLAQFTGLDF